MRSHGSHLGSSRGGFGTSDKSPSVPGSLVSHIKKEEKEISKWVESPKFLRLWHISALF